MVEIVFIPLDGILIQNIGKICLGQTEKDVEKILGAPPTRYLSYYHQGLLSFYNPNFIQYVPIGVTFTNNMQYFYEDLELRIDFDDEHKVEFIEYIGGPFPDKIKPIIYGKEALALPADELIGLLTEKNNGEINDHNGKYIYSFLEIDVGIFREITEAGAKENIEEGKRDGTYYKNKDSFEQDLLKSRHFWTVGIGNKGYYRRLYENDM